MGALESILRTDVDSPKTETRTLQPIPEPVVIEDIVYANQSLADEISEHSDDWTQPVIAELKTGLKPIIVAVNYVEPEFSADVPELAITMADSGITTDVEFTIDEVQQSVRHDHPALRVAREEIAVARAAMTTTTNKENPRFVVDFETPLHDQDAPLELSTRLTFPIGNSRVRRLQYRAAVAEVARVQSEHDILLEEHLLASSTAATQVAYWQDRVALELEDEHLAIRVIGLTQPDKVENDDDPARNTLRHIDAQLDASRAKEQRFASERSLVTARAELAAAMGRPQSIRIAISDDLQSLAQFDGIVISEMRDDIIARKTSTSALVAEAVAQLRRDQHLYQAERERGEDAEIGPTYQDRLGVSDDSAGIRFATNLALHDNQRGPIAKAAAMVRRDQENVRLARSVVIDQINIAYRQWQTITRQLQSYQADDFIEKQQDFLDQVEATDLMTGPQLIEIERAIIRRRREMLDLQFRLAELAVSLLR